MEWIAENWVAVVAIVEGTILLAIQVFRLVDTPDPEDIPSRALRVLTKALNLLRGLPASPKKASRLKS